MDDLTVELSSFCAGLDGEVRRLILGIQQEEFGLPIRAEDQPDLFDIPGVYQRGAGDFWVARAGARVVGTVALFDLGDGLAALRKMFVAPDFRGAPHRVAQRLLDLLLGHARRHGVRVLMLGTTERFHAAHRFYSRNGFVEIPASALPPGWPANRVDVKFYRLELS